MKNEIATLKDDNNTLKNNMKELKNKAIFGKYIIAIQDINRHYEMEKNITHPEIKKNLVKLRKYRVSEYHYVDEIDDNNILINDKKTVLYNKINKEMSEDVKNMFNTKFPNVLNGVMSYIKQNLTNPSETTLNEIEEWWE